MTLTPIPIDKEKIHSYSGLYDLKGLFSHLMNFLAGEMFYDDSMKDYEEVAKDGKKKIVAKIEADKYYNDYYLIKFKFELNFSGNDVEVDIKGKRLILTDGKAVVKLNTYIHPDWQGSRTKTPLGTFLTQLYNKYIGNDDFKEIILETVTDRARFLGEFNKFVNSTLK